MRTLDRGDTIYITKADKGNTTVVSDKVDYLTKAHEQLGSGPYTKIEHNAVETLVTKNKEQDSVYLKRFKDAIFIVTCHIIAPKTNIAPRFYGLPKLQKPNIPIRLIIDGMNSPSHNLAKHPANILRPLTSHIFVYINYSSDYTDRIN